MGRAVMSRAGDGPSAATAPGDSAGLRNRRPLRVRAGIAALAVLGGLLLVCVVSPAVETTPSDVAADDPPAEEETVRVAQGAQTLLYDKRDGWFAAKAAAWFPSVVPSFVPADYVEDETGVVRERRVRLRSRW